MNDKILFLNTGWMDFYRGLSGDRIIGGGKHVETMGWGGEMFNFKDFKGNVYGYAQPKIDKKYNNPSVIKLEKIGGKETDEILKNVTVIWTATDPINRGAYIIGWYKNATVYRHEQPPTKNPQRKFENNKFGFYVTAKTKDSILLSVDERVIEVKRQEKGWMGQSNVWYADKNPNFIEVVKDYIVNGTIPNTKKATKTSTGRARQTDPLKRIAVEKSAINVVTKYYSKLGYEVDSFEKDNLGWDLTATNNRTKLKLEVKGLSGNEALTELTPNEYKNLKADNKFYRVCIVTNALTKPILKIFAFSNDNKKWTSEDGAILNFEDVVSARIYT